MEHYKLTAAQSAANNGRTDLFVVGHADLTATGSGAAGLQTITLATLAVGDEVLGSKTLVEVKTNINVLAAITMGVGITDDNQRFVGNMNLLAAGDEYYAPGLNATSLAPYITTATGKAIEAKFWPGAADNLAAATAGKIHIWAAISRVNERDIQT